MPGRTKVSILALLVVACGANPGDDTGARSPEVVGEASSRESRSVGSLADLATCELLTSAEIEAATGVAPGPGQVERPVEDAPPMCQWPSADGETEQLVHLIVTVNAYDDFADLARAYEEELGGALEGLREIDGIGDFAAWAGDEQWGVLQVYEGGRMLQVSAEPAAGRDRIAASRALAEKALPRLR
jgi:hypothetical protein